MTQRNNTKQHKTLRDDPTRRNDTRLYVLRLYVFDESPVSTGLLSFVPSLFLVCISQKRQTTMVCINAVLFTEYREGSTTQTLSESRSFLRSCECYYCLGCHSPHQSSLCTSGNLQTCISIGGIVIRESSEKCVSSAACGGYLWHLGFPSV